MNYLALGEDTPETQELDFNQYPSNEQDNGPERNDLDWIIYAAKVPRSGEYALRLEQSLMYYEDQAKKIQNLFNQHLSKFGTIHLPCRGLGMWIQFYNPQPAIACIPALTRLGVFKQEKNPFLKTTDTIEGIRIGIASPGTEVWERAFIIMEEQFQAGLN